MRGWMKPLSFNERMFVKTDILSSFFSYPSTNRVKLSSAWKNTINGKSLTPPNMRLKLILSGWNKHRPINRINFPKARPPGTHKTLQNTYLDDNEVVNSVTYSCFWQPSVAPKNCQNHRGLHPLPLRRTRFKVVLC